MRHALDVLTSCFEGRPVIARALRQERHWARDVRADGTSQGGYSGPRPKGPLLLTFFPYISNYGYVLRLSSELTVRVQQRSIPDITCASLPEGGTFTGVRAAR